MRLSEAERKALIHAAKASSAPASFPMDVDEGALENLVRLGFLEKGPIAGRDELGYKTTEAGWSHLNWDGRSAI